MAIQVIEGEIIENGSADDPDLNKAWFDFTDQVNAEANSTGSIAVFEVPSEAGVARPKTLNKTRLFTCAVGTVTLDDICDRVIREYMKPGEKWFIQLYGTMSGRKGVMLNRIIPLRKPHDTRGEDTPTIERLFKLMNEQNERNRADMRSLVESMAQRQLTTVSQAPAVDPLAFGMQLAEKLSVMAANMARPAGPVVDPMQQMMTMMTMMETFKKFLRDGEVPAKADNGEGLAAILREVGGIARPFLLAHLKEKENQAAQLKLAAPARAPEPVRNQPTPAQPEESPHMRLMIQLKEAIPYIIEMAEKNANPGDCAKLALTSMPEDDQALNDALYALVSADDCVKQLAALDARVTAHAEWFEKFRVAVRDEFDPDNPS